MRAVELSERERVREALDGESVDLLKPDKIIAGRLARRSAMTPSPSITQVAVVHRVLHRG